MLVTELWNSSVSGAEARGLVRISDQPGILTENLSQKKNQQNVLHQYGELTPVLLTSKRSWKQLALTPSQ